MRSIILTIVIFSICLKTSSQDKGPAFGPYKMVFDRNIDDLTRPWCYLAKSTTVIGVPHQPGYTTGNPETAIYTYGAVTQVTCDGSLFTNNVELGFCYGENDIPLLARQKTFHRGWIPVIEYSWTHGNILYEIRMLAAVLDGCDESTTLNDAGIPLHGTS